MIFIVINFYHQYVGPTLRYGTEGLDSYFILESRDDHGTKPQASSRVAILSQGTTCVEFEFLVTVSNIHPMQEGMRLIILFFYFLFAVYMPALSVFYFYWA